MTTDAAEMAVIAQDIAEVGEAEQEEELDAQQVTEDNIEFLSDKIASLEDQLAVLSP